MCLLVDEERGEVSTTMTGAEVSEGAGESAASQLV